MDSTTNFSGVGFLALFFLILFVLFFRGGNNFGWNNGWNGPMPYMNGFGYNGVGVPGYGLGFEDYKAICDVEKQAIKSINETNQLINSSSQATTATLQAQISQFAERFEACNTQNLRDKIAEQQATISKLQNEAYTTAAIAPVLAQLNTIQNTMLIKPSLSGVAAVCPNSAIINGLGINGLNSALTTL